MQRALVLGLSCCVALVAASFTDQPGVSAPLIAWTSNKLLGQGPDHARAVYEVASTASTVGDLVLGSMGKLAPWTTVMSPAPGEQPADLVVVYIGSQVDASTLRRAAKLQPQMQQLSSLLDAAGSSVVLPYLRHQGESLKDSLREKLQEHGVGFQAVGCFGAVDGDLAERVRQVASSQDSGLQVLLVCPSMDSAPDHAAALQAEIEQVAAVHAAVEASGRHAVHLYTSQQPGAPMRRQLQGNTPLVGFGNYTECGELCLVQVRWMEGLLGVFIMALAACAGMTCLYLLNTPSRFEVLKEGAQSS